MLTLVESKAAAEFKARLESLAESIERSARGNPRKNPRQWARELGELFSDRTITARRLARENGNDPDTFDDNADFARLVSRATGPDFLPWVAQLFRQREAAERREIARLESELDGARRAHAAGLHNVSAVKLAEIEESHSEQIHARLQIVAAIKTALAEGQEKLASNVAELLDSWEQVGPCITEARVWQGAADPDEAELDAEREIKRCQAELARMQRGPRGRLTQSVQEAFDKAMATLRQLMDGRRQAIDAETVELIERARIGDFAGVAELHKLALEVPGAFPDDAGEALARATAAALLPYGAIIRRVIGEA